MLVAPDGTGNCRIRQHTACSIPEQRRKRCRICAPRVQPHHGLHVLRASAGTGSPDFLAHNCIQHGCCRLGHAGHGQRDLCAQRRQLRHGHDVDGRSTLRVIQSGGFIQNAIEPGLALRMRLSEHWTAGLSVSAPWGLGTLYDRNWAGRYAIKVQASDGQCLTHRDVAGDRHARHIGRAAGAIRTGGPVKCHRLRNDRRRLRRTRCPARTAGWLRRVQAQAGPQATGSD